MEEVVGLRIRWIEICNCRDDSNPRSKGGGRQKSRGKEDRIYLSDVRLVCQRSDYVGTHSQSHVGIKFVRRFGQDRKEAPPCGHRESGETLLVRGRRILGLLQKYLSRTRMALPTHSEPKDGH